MPVFPAELDVDSSTMACHFCDWSTLGTEAEMEDHLESEHSYRACFGRESCDRTFFRKDKLKQHLSNIHGQKQAMTKSQKHWCKPANVEARFNCLFCRLEKMTWAQRVDHVAAHFESGDESMAKADNLDASEELVEQTLNEASW